MSLPDEVQSWIGQVKYEEDTEFPAERGYVYTSCSVLEIRSRRRVAPR